MNFEHYYTKKPTSALRFYEVKTRLRGFGLVFETSTGVFSTKKIDTATKLLIENMKVNKGESFLDLGCGYGPVGVVAAKLGALVSMSDVNERAVMLSKRNVKKNNVSAIVFTADSVNDYYDNIVVNPPIAAGMKLCKSLILDSCNHLKKGGLFQLVARHKKGGERLMNFMEETFNNVETVAKKGGFRVYVSVKS